MRKLFILSYLLLLFLIIPPEQILAETEFDMYINDFYSKTNKATQILKELETNLREGSRNKLCSRQAEAARLGILANKSLIKAFEIEGNKPPMEQINASQKRWESILRKC